jgi:hypothetical protein
MAVCLPKAAASRVNSASHVSSVSHANSVNQTSQTAIGWMSTTTMPIRFLAWVVAQVAAAIKVRAVLAWVVRAPVARKVIRVRVVPAKVVPVKAKVKARVVRAKGAPVKVAVKVIKGRVVPVRRAKVVRVRGRARVKGVRQGAAKVKVSRVRPMVGRLHRGAKAPGAAASQIRCRRLSVLPTPVRVAIRRVRARAAPAKVRVVPSRAVRLRRVQAWIRACRAGAAKADGGIRCQVPGSIWAAGARLNRG